MPVKFFFISILFISSRSIGQDQQAIRCIDSIITNVESRASNRMFDTVKSGLLHEGGTTSDLFLLKQGLEAQKIVINNKSLNYGEVIIFHNNRPIFYQFHNSDGSNWTFYLIGEKSYFKNGDKYTIGSSAGWYDRIEDYLGMFKEQLKK